MNNILIIDRNRLDKDGTLTDIGLKLISLLDVVAIKNADDTYEVIKCKYVSIINSEVYKKREFDLLLKYVDCF